MIPRAAVALVRQSAWARIVWGLLATLQLVVPGALSIADARAEARSLAAEGRSHVEDHSTPRCPPAHGPDCGLCRFLSSTHGTPPSIAQTFSLGDVRATVRPVVTLGGESAARALPESRAPPTLS